MSYPIKQDLKLPGDIGGLNGSGNAKGFLRVDPEAFHSPLAQNKVTAKGGRWIWSKLGGPAMVLAPPETALAVLFRVVSSPGRKQLRNVWEISHSGGPQAQGLTEEYFWKPNKSMPCK